MYVEWVDPLDKIQLKANEEGKLKMRTDVVEKARGLPHGQVHRYRGLAEHLGVHILEPLPSFDDGLQK